MGPPGPLGVWAQAHQPDSARHHHVLASSAKVKIAVIAARAAIGSSPVNHDDTRGTTYPDRNTRAPPPASSVKPRPGWLAHHCRQRWPPSWLGGYLCPPSAGVSAHHPPDTGRTDNDPRRGS
ncbi:Uncharacterised protein [Mycobacteroides abscessus subsp. abscessus]|nr:Uncharacterised protein [Mycobacteroides abscessus subsp. abscessus]